MTYTSRGIISIASALPPIYNGQYVLQATDFGFLWLDTAQLRAGLVQAEAKCYVGQPPSDSNIYVTGDCNGTGTVSSSGTMVLVRQFNSQCGAATEGCAGPFIRGPTRLSFGLGGSWPYLGDLGEIPDSTQTADLQGRTWIVQPTDASGVNFIWISSGIPNSPPFANALAVNLSAGGRADKTNYYGDRWRLRDFSSGGPTNTTWDFNYTGSFITDESGATASEGVVTGYFPCDPNGLVGGNIRTGGNCRQSLGLTNPAPTASYQFALRSSNQFGTSLNTFVSSAISVACPQAVIAGYSGFAGTCSKSGGTLSVPTGEAADASASKGNLAEAAFAWSFTFPSAPPVALPGQVVTVPNGSSGFVLTITFPGGYEATAVGAVALTPALMASFSAPASVLRGSAFIMTNQMEKAPHTTLDSVDWLIAPGSCGAPPAIPTNPLASSFLTAGGTALVTAPNSVGSFCIFLKYNYTSPGLPPSSQVASRPVTVTEWTPAPAIGIYLDSGKTQPAPFLGSSFFLNAGTSYYLFDEEPPPPPGVTYPGAQWKLSSASGETALGGTAAQAPLLARFLKVCSSGCSVSLNVGTTAQQIPVNVSSCASSSTTLCVNGGRFNVQVAWATSDGGSGAGQANPLTSDTGYFWFFSPNNVEIVLKVVDGRPVNSAFWVFAGGLTNVEVTITVTDTLTGNLRTYHNPQGLAFQPIQDTSAFPGASSPEEESRLDPAESPQRVSEAEGRLLRDLQPLTMGFRPDSAASADAACVSNPTTLCLNNGRFQVQAAWTTSDGRTGAGQAVSLTSDTGYFWFFTPNNVEMIVKAVNGCAVNSTYWVFAGGLTNVNVVTTVTDTQTGAVRTYTNPQDTAFQPLQDTSAFPACP